MPPRVSGYQEQLRQVLTLGLSAPQTIPIDLVVAVADKEYSIAGNSFYIFDAPDQTSYIQVKINRTDMPALDLVKQTGFRAPFTKLYITTPAGQAGSMKIVIAAEDPPLFEIIDNRSAISLSMDNILAELRGDITPENSDTEKTVGLTAVSVLAANANRKGAIVQAKDSNLGIIYIGFANTTTSALWVVQLQAGMSWPIDDYRGPIFAISDTAGQLLGWGEW
jgi:hypothetical protein